MVRKLFLKTLNKYASKWLVLCFDVLLVCISFVLAYSIRFNISFNFNMESFITQLPLVFVVALFSFLAVGSYKGIIRHTGTRDAFNVFLGVTIFTTSMIFIILVNQLFKIYPGFTIPKSILLIHYLLCVFTLIFSRYVFKAFYEVVSTEIGVIKNVLIFGAGEAGIITYGALNRDRNNNYAVLGFIDDDSNKINKKIDRIRIYDSKNIDKEFIEKYDIAEVIISTQKLKAGRLLEITDKLLQLKVAIKIVPPLATWIDGNLQANQIKQVNIDDLLDRKQILIDNPIVKKEVNDKVILVTGAAGSIGSEISRQLASYTLKHLILVDQAESDLYDLQQELFQNGMTDFVALVADVRDKNRMREIFEEYRPEKVFHAAAYKHVPLMEDSPYEAVKVNVLGTKNIADLAIQYKVDRFVMVSTDKAVNPTNVMGATKRVAEMYISCVSKHQEVTKFTTTRFGNVLGSNGSVIPLFKRQIEHGGPLTVTHKDITRYFMTIPEACRLVLEAGTMGVGGEIYIFDMGKSVKIYEMAKRMISLSGLKYPEDIDIKITGLRPGEKLYEELLAAGENTVKTYHEKIMIAKTQQVNTTAILELLQELVLKINKLSNVEIVTMLKEMVPEFLSNNSKFEKLDKVG
ncbi:polysaccharide biosynthesis protein [Polaribacter litorisediminis]|uniref:polysaccharide biosynthesis protein n=1 Tax=Polaribacter litorisediminis TaxID=1908341 RepID=UPI001CC0E863|nr:nucleoside-diphosphate sugar epimerase/dehydratase [Polaribacter litorisediminis]UAM96581.1 polysaccharide biosynthesis protein [Polaribacter litorisediminis]